MQAVRSVLLAVLLVMPAAGCFDRPRDGGPLIAGPPKVVVNHEPDNRSQIYVHASVGDVNYTRITLRLDDAEHGEEGFHERNHTYALVVKTNRTSFDANVTVVDGDTFYGFRSSLEINVTANTVVTTTAAGDEQTSDLPFSRVLDKRREG